MPSPYVHMRLAFLRLLIILATVVCSILALLIYLAQVALQSIEYLLVEVLLPSLIWLGRGVILLFLVILLLFLVHPPTTLDFSSHVSFTYNASSASAPSFSP